MAVKKKVKMEKVEEKKQAKVKEENPWRSALTAEKYHEKLLMELEARKKNRGEQIAPDLSQEEYEDYVSKYPEHKGYLDSTKYVVSEDHVKHRTASLKNV